MIGEPPSSAGAAQLIVTSVPEITEIGAAGALGSFGSTAPLPEEEAAELPLEFMART